MSIGGARISIVPSGKGLATIFDKDLILYAISKATHQLNKGQDVSQWVEMTAHEVMAATNRNTSMKDYQRFEDALDRLRGTTIKTNIATGDTLQTKGFGLIDEYEIDRKDEEGQLSPFGRMSRVRMKLSDWTFQAVKAGQVLTINQLYFRLRRPIERRLYELARKHVGDQKLWTINLENLQAKVGSNASLKKFRFVIREVIADGNLPDYSISMENDLVSFRPMVAREAIASVRVKEATLERGREMARQKGYDFYALLSEWESMVAEKGAPKSPDGALIGFIKKKPSLRQGTLL